MVLGRDTWHADRTGKAHQVLVAARRADGAVAPRRRGGQAERSHASDANNLAG